MAAYNNGSAQDIEMIKDLCEQTNEGLFPIGGGRYYTCLGGSWVGSYVCENLTYHPVSWFFEPDPFEKRIEALEKAVEEIKALLVLYKNNGLTK